MHLNALDICVLIVYLGVTLGIGYYAANRATQNMESYFLAGKKLPWYVLGVSDASCMFDITGTMWLVTMMFVYGLKSVWFPWIWPVFNQIFLMVYLSRWVRRSNALTGAEWIIFRFGKNKGAQMAHIAVVMYAVISVIGFLAYGFKGAGKFAATLIEYRFFINDHWNEAAYTALLSFITALYVVKGGMFSVVFTEIAQYTVLVLASLCIGWIAVCKVSPEMIASHTPPGWDNMWFGWKVELDWSGLVDAVNLNVENDGFSMITMVFTMMAVKGIVMSAAGPAPGYDMQRILAAKSPKEAAKVNFFVNIALYFPRYILIAGLAILSVAYLQPQMNAMGNKVDFDLILPYILQNFIPAGLLGLVLAGFISAYMSNFAATVNAAPAYLVNDVYKRYINPDASDRKYVRLSRIMSVAIILIGIVFSFCVQSINTITQWITASLLGGFTAANLLKWYWWRFNSHGYFWGMLAGTGAALALPLLAPGLSALDGFPIILGLSVSGCFIATFLTPADDEAVLKNFYKQVRPWGFWKPIRDKVRAETPGLTFPNEFGRDMVNIVVGMVWQMALVVLPVFLVLRAWPQFWTATFVVVVSSVILKFSWWDKLTD
jgi:solute:Na+ symporter, SSS family